MSEGFQVFDIILFAMVAAFILLRLRGVLGRRTGHERRPPNPLAPRPVEEAPDKAARRSEPESAPAGGGDDFSDVSDSALAAGLTQIRLADPGFARKRFLEGTAAAFEMIVGAYAAGDAKTLRPLLSDEVYEPFAAAARERADAGLTLDTEVVSVEGTEIIEAGMNGRTAFVTVRIVSLQINVTRDSEESVIEGDPAEALEVIDIWTFERDTRSRDPNWQLVATRSLN